MKQSAGAREFGLAEVQRQFSEWRRSKAAGSVIPRELWDAAVSLAAHMSPAKVAKELGLNYSDLCRRIATGAGERPESEAAAAFLEASPLAGTSAPCLIEMHNQRGETLRIHLAANQPLDLVGLGRAFWGMPS